MNIDQADLWLMKNDPELTGVSASQLANRRLRQGHALGVALDGVQEIADLVAGDAIDFEEAARREARAEAAILLACTRPRDREIIARRVGGQGIPEVADALGMTRQGVWAALARIERAARAAVQAAMRQDDGQEQAGLATDAIPMPMLQDAGGQLGWNFAAGVQP